MQSPALPGDDSGFDELSKEKFIEIVKSAGAGKSEEAMEVMGYVCTVRDGWVVNVHKDGRVELLHRV